MPAGIPSVQGPALAVTAGGVKTVWWPGRAFGVSGLVSAYPGTCFVNFSAVKENPPGARGDALFEDALAGIPVRRNQP